MVSTPDNVSGGRLIRDVNSMQTHPFLHALRRWGSFLRAKRRQRRRARRIFEWKMVNFKLGEQMWRWHNRRVTSLRQRRKSESQTGLDPMTSQTPGGRSIHWATENSWRERPYTGFKKEETNWRLTRCETNGTRSTLRSWVMGSWSL